MENIELIKFNNWKVRCSSISDIITKSGNITQGVETFLKSEYVEIVRNYKEEFTTKYTQKGKFCEHKTADFIQTYLHTNRFIYQNKEQKENDYIKGTCDFYLQKDNLIIDAKNSFNWKTFNDAKLSDDYEWQLRGYMWLWNTDKSHLLYTLFNLPEHELQSLEKKLFYSKQVEFGWVTFESPDFIKECEVLRDNYDFEKHPMHHRFKIFEVEKDQSKIDLIIEMVIKCREWLTNYHKIELERISKNLEIINR